MLYKKYHRNFVRKFKVGFRFKLRKDSCFIQTTFTDPFIKSTSVTSKPYITVGIDENNVSAVLNLVYTSGRLMGNCYVV